MKKSPSHLSLNKQRVLRHNGYRVYRVCSLAMRYRSLGDEEFGSFATPQEFPRMIPKIESTLTGIRSLVGRGRHFDGQMGWIASEVFSEAPGSSGEPNGQPPVCHDHSRN